MIKSDMLLDASRLSKCCGQEPVFHKFSSIAAYGIECRVNGKIHHTFLHNTEKGAIEDWEQIVCSNNKQEDDK